MGDSEDFWEEEARYEAEMEAQGEAYHEEIGKQYVRDNRPELKESFYKENYERAYEQAIGEFAAERLQSYYLKESQLAVPALNSVLHAKELLDPFHKAALLFAVTATELTIKDVLLKPITFGLVHTEDLAAFIAELTTKHTGMDRFRTLLTEILAAYGGVELKTFKRNGSSRTLWEEITVVQNARNSVAHRGESCDLATARLSISVAETLLHEIFPTVLKKLSLHLHKPISVCACKSPQS